MKIRDFLSRVEEVFYFNASYYFWHLVTGLGGLSIFCACLAFIWAILPASKPVVRKDAYPAPPAISYEEVARSLAGGGESPSKESAPPLALKSAASEVAAVDDVSQDEGLQREIGKLRNLLSEAGLPWETKGHWRREAWVAPVWVVDRLGLKDLLEQAFGDLKAKTVPEKMRLVKAYTGLIEGRAAGKRAVVMDIAAGLRKGDVSATVERIEGLTAITRCFPPEEASYIGAVADFLRENPAAVAHSAASALPKFAQESRLEALRAMLGAYARRFGHAQLFAEATAAFAALAGRFEADDQVKSLERFYELYVIKNRERMREIEKIDAKHQLKTLVSEARFQAKVASKKMVKAASTKAAGAGVFFMAVVTLLLVFLSIQRELKALRRVLVDKAGIS